MLTLLIPILGLITCIFSKPIVKLGDTNIVGRQTVSSFSTEFFGGIPFAEPPLGPLRLNLPVLLPKLEDGTFSAENFGPGCLQTPAPPSGTSEDCLTLDIYRPSGISSDAKLPVLVWIYGGYYVVGASSFYNGTSLVEHSIRRGTPILFVSINHRLGPLGFPQGIEAGQNKILNLGLHDQLTALEWIQQNIGSFGGDKTKVTVGGESAGAASIMLHFLRPTIKKLARATILESGGTLPQFGPERNEANWQQFVAALPACAPFVGTDHTFDCVRASDSASLERAIVNTNLGFGNKSFVPVIDGPGGLLVDRPSRVQPQGFLPTLLGSNLDEGTLFALQNTNSTAQIRDLFIAQFSPPVVSPQKLAETIELALELYPDVPSLGSPFDTGNETFGLSSQYKRLSAMFGDFLTTSVRRSLSQNISEAGLPVFAFVFADRDSVAFTEFNPFPPNPKSLGVPHTAEIPYVFGTLINSTPRALALSSIIQDYWISFVNNLDPSDDNGQCRPKWENYTRDNQVVIRLDGQHTSLIPDDYRKRQIALWQENADVLHR